MKLSRILRLFLAASLLLLILAAAVACGDKTVTPTDETTAAVADTTLTTEAPAGTETEPASETEPVVEPGTDAPDETEAASGSADETVADTGSESDTAAVTDGETEGETEPETLYDIMQKEVFDLVEESCFNVKDYGAKGDGITDDSAAIQAAVTAAQKGRGVLYFPDGEYLVESTITASRNDGLILKLLGRNATLVGGENLNGPIL